MEEQDIDEDHEIFENLSRTIKYGIRFENDDFESSSAEVVRKLTSLAKCRDCDMFLHSRDDVKNFGRFREDIDGDGETHADNYGHTVDVIIDEGDSFILKTYNPR